MRRLGTGGVGLRRFGRFDSSGRGFRGGCRDDGRSCLRGLQLLELVLQLGDFVLLEREQTLVVAVDLFQVLDSRFELGHFLLAAGQRLFGAGHIRRILRIAGARSCAGMIAGVLPTLACTRRHQGQMGAGRPTRRLAAGMRCGFGFRCAGLRDQGWFGYRSIRRPGLILLAHCGRNGGGRSAGLDFVARGNAQDRAALERIDVVAIKRLGIGLEQGQHHSVQICVVVRTRCAGDFRQRFAARYRTVFAGTRGVCSGRRFRRFGFCRCRFGMRNLGSRWLDGGHFGFGVFVFGRQRLRPCARRFVRGCHRCRGGAGGRRHYRRIKQHSVFAQQLALGPVRLDQEVEQRFAHDLLGGDLDHRLAVAVGADGKLQRHIHLCAIQTYALEVLGGGQRHFKTAGLGGRIGDHGYYRVKRLVELGSDLDRSQAKRKRIAADQRQCDRKRQFCRSFHEAFPQPVWHAPAHWPTRLEARKLLITQT